jgi:hypothetical protein
MKRKRTTRKQVAEELEAYRQWDDRSRAARLARIMALPADEQRAAFDRDEGAAVLADALCVQRVPGFAADLIAWGKDNFSPADMERLYKRLSGLYQIDISDYLLYMYFQQVGDALKPADRQWLRQMARKGDIDPRVPWD